MFLLQNTSDTALNSIVSCLQMVRSGLGPAATMYICYLYVFFSGPQNMGYGKAVPTILRLSVL